MSKETRNLLLFLVLTMLATYAAYFTIVWAGWNPFQAPGLILFLIGGSAPSWVGLLLVFFSYDKDQRKAYFKRLSPKLIPGRWWVIMPLIMPAVYVIVYAIELMLGGTLPGMEPLSDYIAQPAILPLVIFIGLGSGPISEEFGWRGVALDPMIRRFGRIPGTIILGLIWGIWHLGLFFMPQTWHGQLGFRFAGFFTFILASVGLALIMTWVHTHTKGSILAAILMHYLMNFTSTALSPQPDRALIIEMVIVIVTGLTLNLAIKNKPLPQRTAEAQG